MDMLVKFLPTLQQVIDDMDVEEQQLKAQNVCLRSVWAVLTGPLGPPSSGELDLDLLQPW